MASVELRLVDVDGGVVVSTHGMFKTDIVLQFKRLVDVSDNVSLLTNVFDVWLDQNKLAAVPAGLLRMTQLELLSLANNRLRSLDIGAWRQMSVLSVAHNSISAVPASISTLHSLKRLVLTSNALVTLPPELARLQKLETLAVENNELKWLPVELDCLPAFTNVRLDLNSLPLRVAFNENVRPRLAELFGVTTQLGMIRRRATDVAIGLQDLELPALVTLEIVDAAWDNAIPMHKKWELVTAVKHFHQRH